MDVLKFMKERRRMCNYYSRCLECPRADEPNCNIEEMSDEKFENFVNTVEQWSKEHPQKTRFEDLLEKYPSVKLSISGYPMLCCRTLGYCDECLHGSNGCKDCWNMPVEEDE